MITRTQHITCTYHQLGHQLHPSTFVTYTTRSVSLRSTTYHTHTTSSRKRHQEQDNDVLSLCTQHITARSRRTPGPRQSFSKRETLDPSLPWTIFTQLHISRNIYIAYTCSKSFVHVICQCVRDRLKLPNNNYHTHATYHMYVASSSIHDFLSLLNRRTQHLTVDRNISLSRLYAISLTSPGPR
jgi:hypothetical protein